MPRVNRGVSQKNGQEVTNYCGDVVFKRLNISILGGGGQIHLPTLSLGSCSNIHCSVVDPDPHGSALILVGPGSGSGSAYLDP